MNVEQEIKAGDDFCARLSVRREHRLIGSAAIVPDQAADVDYAVLLDRNIDLIDYTNIVCGEHAFTPCSNYDKVSGEDTTWTSVRRGNLNLMLTVDEDWFKRYVAAMEVCRYLTISKKADRIAICRIVRDRFTADQARQEADLAVLRKEAAKQNEIPFEDGEL